MLQDLSDMADNEMTEELIESFQSEKQPYFSITITKEKLTSDRSQMTHVFALTRSVQLMHAGLDAKPVFEDKDLSDHKFIRSTIRPIDDGALKVQYLVYHATDHALVIAFEYENREDEVLIERMLDSVVLND